jgi:hypothetical protein
MMNDRAGRVFKGGFPFLRLSLPLALLLGLALRVALWDQLPRLGLVGDEAEYLAAADWLANGRGFAWHLQYFWTRAPLYPLFLAAHLALFGDGLTAIFVSQTVLSLLNVVLVYLLTTQVIGNRQQATGDRQQARVAPGIAALLAAVYLPFAMYGQLILSETLFTTLLLGALAVLGTWALRGGWFWLVGAGVLLGLATLTRGLTLGFVPIVAIWIVFQASSIRNQASSIKHQTSGIKHQESSIKHQTSGKLRAVIVQVCLFTCTFGLVLLPWTIYASRAYGGLVVVDTTGAFNLALGARTAYDGGRSDAPLRNFVLALLDPTLSQDQRRELLADPKSGACLYAANDTRIMRVLETPAAQISQAERQSLLSAEAFCLLQQAPDAFVTKSLVELIDLFQINYTGDERLSKGFALGRLPVWYALALFLLDDTLYVLALPLAVVGWALGRQEAGGMWQVREEASHITVPRTQNNEIPPPASRGSTELAKVILLPASYILTPIILWLLYNLGTAPLLFAINRFRVPLMPLVFVLAGVALANLPRWGGLRTRYGAACATLAALLLLIATTPYAYLEPRDPDQPSHWASYLGPYPSSLASTWLALQTRSGYLAEQQLADALGAGDVTAIQAALQNPDLPGYAAAVGAPLLDGLQGQPATGLDRLANQPVQPLEDWQRSLIAGELFRQLGDIEAARRELNPPLVDDQNPVEWAWQWLHPPPTPANRITVADDNDLGYVRGFYLGRYDSDLEATVRWATGESALLFPQAASGTAQQICFNISGLGWPTDLKLPTITASLNNQDLGSFALTRELHEVCLDLPAQPTGSDLTIMLRGATFVPDALDLVRQQGPQVGQLRRLSFQLDWAEVR